MPIEVKHLHLPMLKGFHVDNGEAHRIGSGSKAKPRASSTHGYVKGSRWPRLAYRLSLQQKPALDIIDHPRHAADPSRNFLGNLLVVVAEARCFTAGCPTGSASSGGVSISRYQRYLPIFPKTRPASTFGSFRQHDAAKYRLECK